MAEGPSPPTRREHASWCLFDFANSPYVTIMVTVFYGRFFQAHAVPPHLASRSHTLWAATISLSMAIVALTSPVAGAIADRSGIKKRLLATYVALSAGATALIALWPLGTTAGMVAAMATMVVANAGFEGGYVFYNAFLPELATSEKAGRLSGYGWALGYVGGLVALAMVMALGLTPPQHGPVGDRWRAIPLLVSAWFVLFALPMLLLVRERAPRRPAPPGGYLREGFRGVRETVRTIRNYPDLLRFLVAYLIFTDALETVIVFTATFSAEVLHFSDADNVKLFLLLNLMAIPGAVGFGRLVDAWGGVKTVALTLVLWIVVIFACVAVQTKTQFLGIAVLAALCIGGTQSAARAVVARFVPGHEAARVFGFMTMAGRASAVVGPLVYGVVADVTGSMRMAVAAISVFFVVGIALLLRVDEARALARVREDAAATALATATATAGAAAP